MKLEELARLLAESMGTGAYLHERTRGIVLRAELHNHGLPNDDRTVIRLQDMVDNITEEVFRDWDGKRREARRLPGPDEDRSAALSTALSAWASGRPEMLSDRLGYPSSAGDVDWVRTKEERVIREDADAYQRGLEDGGA